MMLCPLEPARLGLLAFTDVEEPNIHGLAKKEIAYLIGLPYPYNLSYAESWNASQSALVDKEIEFPFAIIL